MTVAATVILVQNSLALAFTLAAIVAAVRFRNTLKDTKDAVYIFLALAVGVAAGVFSPTVAAVMSVMFNIVVLVLWELNVGNIYADQRGRVPALAPAEGLLGPRRRASAALAVGDPDLLAALAPPELEGVAGRAARLQAYVMARAGDKKEERFNGMLLVHTTQPEAAQRVIEELLQIQARRWRLAEIVPAEAGRSTLEYLIRLRDEILPATLLDALKGRRTPPGDPDENRSLRRFKKPKEEGSLRRGGSPPRHSCASGSRDVATRQRSAPVRQRRRWHLGRRSTPRSFSLATRAGRPRRPIRSRCSSRSGPRPPPRRTPSSCSWATMSTPTACPTRPRRAGPKPSACSNSSCGASRPASPAASSSPASP